MRMAAPRKRGQSAAAVRSRPRSFQWLANSGQLLPVADIPPAPRRTRWRRQHEERRAAHGLGLQAVPDRPAEKLAPRPLAGEGKDLRAVAQDGRAQALPVEVIAAELRIDPGHRLDQIGEYAASTNEGPQDGLVTWPHPHITCFERETILSLPHHCARFVFTAARSLR